MVSDGTGINSTAYTISIESIERQAAHQPVLYISLIISFNEPSGFLIMLQLLIVGLF